MPTVNGVAPVPVRFPTPELDDVVGAVASLALPRGYDGPILISDIDGTLRDTSFVDLVAGGGVQRPIPGARALLDEAARRGVPIVYLSAASEGFRGVNERFLAQLPTGVLLDRKNRPALEVFASNRVRAERQGAFKGEVIDALKRAYPSAQLFGLGDDKFGDAGAYMRHGVRAFIHDIDASHANVPAGFNGALSTGYTPAFIRALGAELDRAQKNARHIDD